MTVRPAGIAIHRRDLRTDWSENARAVLSPDERSRAGRFVREDDRRRFVIGRHLIRTTLAPICGCAAPDVPIAIDAHGRPHVVDAPSFSLTHAGPHVALAIASGQDAAPGMMIGIDIEAVRDDIDPLALASHVFARAELEALQDAPDRVTMFFRLWTLKEAVLKAAGRGLLADPRTLCIDARSGLPRIRYAPADVPTGGCMVLEAPPHHAAALAWCRNTAPSGHRLFTMSDTPRALPPPKFPVT